MHHLVPYAASVAGFAAVLDPGQPFAAHDAHDVREVPGAFLAPLGDGDKAEAFGVAKGFWTVRRHAPARAAISSMDLSHSPRSRCSSAMMRKTATSAGVKLCARCDGSGPL